MKKILYIIFALTRIGCNPTNHTNPPSTPSAQPDSVYVTADFRKHGNYYGTGHQIFAIDLLSNGLTYDSTYHISGTGYNLFLSDVFIKNDSLVAGHYEMDSVVRDTSFLRGMDFEGNITGTYLLQIQDDKVLHITLFTAGSMEVSYHENEIRLDFTLYTIDSTRYHATYQGSAIYR